MFPLPPLLCILFRLLCWLLQVLDIGSPGVCAVRKLDIIGDGGWGNIYLRANL